MGNTNDKNLGIIITTENISAVEIQNGKKGPEVTNYSKIILDEGIIEGGCIIINAEAFQAAIEKLLRTAVGGPISTEKVLIALPEERIFSHQVTIPKDKLEDIDFIKETAKDIIPIDLDEAVFDYKVSHEDKNGENIVLNFVAAQSSVVDPIMKVLKQMNLDVVGIDININCLIRSFNNTINNTEGDFLLINMSLEQDLIVVSSETGGIYKKVSKVEREDQINQVKALLNVSTSDEVRDILLRLKNGEVLSPNQEQDLKNAFKEYVDGIKEKIDQIVKIASSNEAIAIGTIYLTGIYSAFPGMKEGIQAVFPEAALKTKLEFTDIPGEIEYHALQGIGICLKGAFENDKNDFNLLPTTRKHELNIAKITPQLKIFALATLSVLILIILNTGINAVKYYLDYRISSQEVVILNAQLQNPYLTQVAKTKRETQTSQGQILSVLDDALPVAHIMRDLDIYNYNGVSLVNINYSDRVLKKGAEITLRAKANSRVDTEKFVESLEKSNLYTNVLSPISNLVGKGERFINISLAVDKKSVMQAFEAAKATMKAAAEQPPKAEQPIEVKKNEAIEVPIIEEEISNE